MRAALLALLLATPAAAQDVTADFASAYTRLYGEGAPDRDSAAFTGLATLQDIAGHWIPGDAAFQQPQLDPAQLANYCADGFGLRIERLGTFGFTMTSLQRGELQGDTRTFTFATGRYFTTITDLDGHLDRMLGGRDPEQVPAQVLLTMTLGTSGIARVEPVGDDVLMIDSADIRPMILVRCP
ncbi:hypothetical protein HKCCE4037_18795 [Rhodobacterales bacterium HKCCE4037]|nr:hypothetical protein [Rhodobacterales bacterium HKCCE4037]